MMGKENLIEELWQNLDDMEPFSPQWHATVMSSAKSFKLVENDFHKNQNEELSPLKVKLLAIFQNYNPSGWQGWIDDLDKGFLHGWATNLQNSQASIDIYANDTPVIRHFFPTLPRPDVQKAGIGNGLCGFKISIPHNIVKSSSVIFTIRDSQTHGIIAFRFFRLMSAETAIAHATDVTEKSGSHAALPLWLELLDIYPKIEDIYAGAIAASVDVGDFVMANKIALLSLRHLPAVTYLYYLYARIPVKEKNWEEVLRRCAFVRAKYHERPWVYMLEGEAFRALGDSTAEEACYAKGVEMCPDSQELLVKFTDILIEHKKFDKAMIQIRRLCWCFPNKADGWLKKIQIYGEMEAWTKAKSAAASGLAANSDNLSLRLLDAEVNEKNSKQAYEPISF